MVKLDKHQPKLKIVITQFSLFQLFFEHSLIINLIVEKKDLLLV